jgi:ABC-2 type transport system permease protein
VSDLASDVRMMAAVPPRRSLARIYWLEARAEVLKAMRLPAFVAPLLAFPAMFYLLFGVLMKSGPVGGFNISEYLLATYAAFGVMNAALFGFGVGVAAERGQGWLLVKRATPMPAGAMLVGRLATSLLFGVAVIVLLYILGFTLGHVRLPAATLVELGAVLAAGALPFAALGLAVGYLAGPNSAPVVCNLIALPVSFASGLWIPYPFLPPVVRQVAHAMPAYHYSQLALDVLGKGNHEPALWSVLYLVGFTALMLLLARVGYLRDEGRTFG